MPISIIYNKPLTDRLLSLYQRELKDLLTVDLFSVYLLSRVDIVIRYIEVDFTFRLPGYVRYIEVDFTFGLPDYVCYIEVRYIEVVFHTFYCNFCPDIEYRSLYLGLR